MSDYKVSDKISVHRLCRCRGRYRVGAHGGRRGHRNGGWSISLSCPITRFRTRFPSTGCAGVEVDIESARMAGGGAIVTAVGPSLMRGLSTACPWVRRGVPRSGVEHGSDLPLIEQSRVPLTVVPPPGMGACGMLDWFAALLSGCFHDRVAVRSVGLSRRHGPIDGPGDGPGEAGRGSPRRAGRSSPDRPDAGGSAMAPPPRSHGPTPAGGGKPHSRRDRPRSKS